MDRLEKVDKTLVGERLKASRKSLKLTQKKISAELGVPQSNVSLYETGETAASTNFLLTYAKKFGVSVDYLLGISENERTLDIRDLLKEGKVSLIADEDKISIEINDDELKEILGSLQDNTSD